jgi:predicted DNA-binding transcriptional regulator AlpA
VSDLLTTREVAAKLRISPETVLRWHRTGKLPGGRRLSSSVLRFDAAVLDVWIRGRGAGGEVSPTPDADPARVLLSGLSPTPLSGGEHAR